MSYGRLVSLKIRGKKSFCSNIHYSFALGANVNCSSPIIGSPLHVACSDNIPNRFEILTVSIKVLQYILLEKDGILCDKAWINNVNYVIIKQKIYYYIIHRNKTVFSEREGEKK